MFLWRLLWHMTVREETWVLHFLVPASLITDQQLSHEQAPDWTGHEKYRDSVTWTHGVSLRFFNFPTANIDKLMIEHVVTKNLFIRRWWSWKMPYHDTKCQMQWKTALSGKVYSVFNGIYYSVVPNHREIILVKREKIVINIVMKYELLLLVRS